jgi:CRP-like cAMP-binding protein
LSGEGSIPVLKLGLRRMSLEDRMSGDEELRMSALVRLLGPGPLGEVLAQSSGRRFAAGARLFLEGDAGQALVFVLKGEARLLAGSGTEMVEVAVARKGEVVGEQEALGACATRAYTAQAVGELEVLEIPRSLLERLAPAGSALQAHLREVASARSRARAELTDFLNRW